MNGKKFVGIFLVAVVITSIGMGVWMKHAYDTRPQVEITPETK